MNSLGVYSYFDKNSQVLQKTGSAFAMWNSETRGSTRQQLYSSTRRIGSWIRKMMDAEGREIL